MCKPQSSIDVVSEEVVKELCCCWRCGTGTIALSCWNKHAGVLWKLLEINIGSIWLCYRGRGTAWSIIQRALSCALVWALTTGKQMMRWRPISLCFLSSIWSSLWPSWIHICPASRNNRSTHVCCSFDEQRQRPSRHSSSTTSEQCSCLEVTGQAGNGRGTSHVTAKQPSTTLGYAFPNRRAPISFLHNRNSLKSNIFLLDL